VASTFLPAADSFVNPAAPSTNYGAATTLRVTASPQERAYLRFNVQGVTGHIVQATLRVHVMSNSNAGYQVSSIPDNNWGEMTINHANAPASSPTIIGSSGPTKAGSWTTVDVTALVAHNGTFTFVLTTSSGQINLASRESGANAPQLVIVTGP
jgi:hypothetical protein